jgi:hypothetical protein
VGTSTHLVPTSEFGNHFQGIDCDLGGQNVNELVATTFCAPIVVSKSAFADLKVVAQMYWERGGGQYVAGNVLYPRRLGSEIPTRWDLG